MAKIQQRPVPGTPLWAGEDGVIYDAKGAEVASRLTPKGYRVYTWWQRPYGQKRARGHRLVAMAWHGAAPFRGAPVDHVNRVRDDNRPCNLRWSTDSENNRNRVFKVREERPKLTVVTPPYPVPTGVELEAIPGWEGFLAGSDGRVYSQWKGQRHHHYPVRVLPMFRLKGHLTVAIGVSRHRSLRRVSSLVAAAFLPLEDGRMHPKLIRKNGDIDDTRPENLEYHALPVLTGYNPGNRKLARADILAIRERHDAGEHYRAIAGDYPGVHVMTIRNAALRRTFADVV